MTHMGITCTNAGSRDYERVTENGITIKTPGGVVCPPPVAGCMRWTVTSTRLPAGGTERSTMGVSTHEPH